jgi:pimeloyl-ACP methyl ester carboxylesterase
MGRSGEVTPGRWNDEDIVNAEVLHALMKHLNVEKYFVAGHSFGGRVTGMICAMYPDEVLGGCLITNVPFNWPPPPPGQPSMIQVGTMMAATPEGFRTFQALCDVSPGKPPRNPQILRFFNEEGEKYWRRSTYDPNAAEREKSMFKDRSEFAKKITCPLLFITADEDFFSPLTLQERASFFPNSALHCFSGMGHMFPLIEIAGTAGVLSRWMSRNLPSAADASSKATASPTSGPVAPEAQV